ncbi:MAG: hypothetical protein OXG91_05015 [bacterium]|nr:hypothetical protein [bacterium]
MYEQMIDLAHPRGAIVFWLAGILEPQAVQHEDIRVFRETSVQVVRHLPLSRDASLLARIARPTTLFVWLDDHLSFSAFISASILG